MPSAIDMGGLGQSIYDMYNGNPSQNAMQIVTPFAQIIALAASTMPNTPVNSPFNFGANATAAIATIIKLNQDSQSPGGMDPQDWLSLAGNVVNMIAAAGSTVHPGIRLLGMALGAAGLITGSLLNGEVHGAGVGNPMGDIDGTVGTHFNNAQTPPRRDPLILDLNGDGIVSHTSLAQSTAYFDHDLDGVATHTGWVGAGDGLLVYDKNANGLIDNGSELFGDHFLKANGQYAIDGFDALASLDANGDGQFNALDAAFAQVQVWIDANGNGITDAGELQSLTAAGIASFTVTPTSTSTGAVTAGQNQTAASGSYQTTAGTQSGMGTAMQDINLAQDTFHSQFLTQVPLTASAENAALVMGSGLVRGTQEAASLNTVEGAAFAQALAGFEAIGTHAGQWAANDAAFKIAG